MPGTFNTLPDPKRSDPPMPSAAMHSSAMVFATVESPATIGGVVITDRSGAADEGEVDLEPGSQHILKFRDVEPLITEGRLKLI